MTVNSVRLIKAPDYSNDLHCHELSNFVASVTPMLCIVASSATALPRLTLGDFMC